jgi:hypothetical protein
MRILWATSKIYLQIILQSLTTYFEINLITFYSCLRQIRQVVKNLLSCYNILSTKRKQLDSYIYELYFKYLYQEKQFYYF